MTEYAVEAPNLTSSGQVSKDPIGHVMASVLWNREWVLMIDYLYQLKTVTGVYYAGLVYKLLEAVKENVKES